jgi:UDP-N-acetylmuramoyl-tripeptide--D-alanyl-D-alanine ligase
VSAQLDEASSLHLRLLERMPGWWRLRSLMLPHVATLHRKRLGGVTFVAVTGSAGKTTTKILSTAVLASAGKIRPWPGTMNNFDHIMSVVVATKPSDDFCVIEFSAGSPGSLDRSLEIVKPRIGVVTSIGTDHLKAYHSVEAIAEEKSKVISTLPKDGVAVLNADDPLVISMARRFSGRLITYGLAETAMLRADHVCSEWPDRLRFAISFGGRRAEIQTQLCGVHWLSSVLAAIAVGLAADIPLEQAVSAVQLAEPYPSRMFPVAGRDGVSFVVDDWKSSVWTMASVFDFLKTARARRKIAVIGTLSDYGGNAGATYGRVATSALEAADHVIFVGPMATHALRAKRAENAQRLHVFPSIKGAADFLDQFLAEDDLVAVKGSVNADHLGRIAHNWVEPISCWSMTCRKNMPCSSCNELRTAGPGKHDRGNTIVSTTVESGRQSSSGLPSRVGTLQIFVGIGNPGDRYRNTPHNVGFDIADVMAQRLGATWQKFDDLLLAQSVVNGNTVLLVKPQNYVNNIGKTLKGLSAVLDFTATECTLLQDDVHLPFGKIRSRVHGSDGGHKGVRSVLAEFQTNEFKRIKIGVASDGAGTPKADYLVTPLSAEDTTRIAAAVEAAADRIMSVLKQTDAAESLAQSRASIPAATEQRH